MTVTIYHNAACGTSRNTLALIRNAGIEPVVVDYLATPPDRDTLVDLIARSGLPVRDVVRQKEQVYAALHLDAPETSDDQLIDAMLAHPILINRPLVVVDGHVRLCRPSEVVLDILPAPQQGAFTKEDGERVVDEQGRRVPHG
ncbi:MAG: arsenate reductase (glutaredoxin) [Pseudomonadota bacterium]|nr:arsenate reductase (glutaredoxin) [Pseudomonadota bacterium]